MIVIYSYKFIYNNPLSKPPLNNQEYSDLENRSQDMDPNRQRSREYRRWQKKKEKDRGEGPFPSMPVQRYPFRPQKGFRRQGVVKGFADFYRDEDKRELRGNALQNRLKSKEYKGTRAQKFPYGSRWDIDPDTWHEELGTFKGQKKVLPVQGPPNWTDIWNDQSLYGTDNEDTITTGEPLSDKQIQWLRSATDSQISPENRLSSLTDIEFMGTLGKGWSKVWKVRARKDDSGGKVEMACKVIGKLKADIDNEEEEDEDDMIIGALASQFMPNYGELFALRFVSHPHIVAIEDIICIPDQRTAYPFSSVLIFMELMGGTLNDIIKDCQQLPAKTMSEEVAKYWFRQIVSALKFLHSDYEHGGLDMAHNDLQDGNIFHLQAVQRPVDEQTILGLTFKLGDFGSPVLGKKLGMTPTARTDRMSAKREDIRKLGTVLANSLGVPPLERLIGQTVEQFAERNHLSLEVISLIHRMRTLRFHMSISKVLCHRWLSGR